jgi:hypothetical protein
MCVYMKNMNLVPQFLTLPFAYVRPYPHRALAGLELVRSLVICSNDVICSFCERYRPVFLVYTLLTEWYVQMDRKTELSQHFARLITLVDGVAG